MSPPVPGVLRRAGYWVSGVLARAGQNVATAFVQIWANKGRSVLTTLGIIIAVTSIITVVSLVEGFGGFLARMLRGYGTQFMVVRPQEASDPFAAGGRRVSLDLRDIYAVQAECPTLRRLSPFVFQPVEITYGRSKATQIPLRGVAEQYQIIRQFHADAGRFFGPVDVDRAAHVCVLGRTLLKLLECDDSILGDHALIDGQRFQVIGLLESKGSFMGEDQDETVMIPYTTALNMYPHRRESLPFLAEATNEEAIAAAEAEIKRVLRSRHRLRPGQPDDFSISRQDQVLRQFGQIRTVATSVLAGIVSISLLVGGIGIMNVMLVSVTERTREIGLRKSVGARRRDIMVQFLTEAVVLSVLGGALGVAAGYGLTQLAARHPQMVELDVPWWSVVLALGFSAGAGVVFGVIPAFKAAILHPIDALRYE